MMDNFVKHFGLNALALSMLVMLVACNRAEPDKAESAQKPAVASPDKSSAPSPSNLVSQATTPGESSSAERQPAPSNAQQGSPAPSGESVAPSVAEPDKTAAVMPPNLSEQPGLTIETVPNLDAVSPETPVEPLETRLADRGFMKLNLPDAVVTAAPLLAFLDDCDRAVQELAIVRQATQINEAEFLQQAKRISSMKLKAGQRLSVAAGVNPQQRKKAIAAQVESLSQLTGLGDIEAAQMLQKVATELAASSDPELAHQGKLVLLGFRLNQLQEGVIKDPQVILSDIDQVLKAPELGLVEFLALQKCGDVLSQMGYVEPAKAVEDRLVQRFSQSRDRDLAMRAWSIAVNNSPQLIAYNEACRAVYEGTEVDVNKVGTTADEFYKAFPSPNTLSYFLRMIVDLEYAGRITAARSLASVVERYQPQAAGSIWENDIRAVLQGHSTRLGLLDKPIKLDELVGIDGTPFDWSTYRGKVVLIYFWASIDVQSLNLQARVKELRERITGPDFEIIGINLDDNLLPSNTQKLELAKGTFGRIVHSSNAAAQGFQTAAAQALGVTSVPFFAALVDKSGTVRVIHPDFDRLPDMIAELMK